jgi:rSAM/selenodomain-associated transferase 1
VAYKKLGIFVKTPVPGEVKTRLSPPLEPQEACELYRAFIAELVVRLSRLKKVSLTVFYAGFTAAELEGLVPARTSLVPQEGSSPGERLENAFRTLLARDGAPACVIGSGSPDLPLAYVKRAFVKLKHKEIVLGPSLDGGCYLIGLQRPVPDILRGISWGGSRAFRDTIGKVKSQGLSLGLIPPWYDVDDEASLALLETMLIAKKTAGGDGLPRVERALSSIRERARER